MPKFVIFLLLLSYCELTAQEVPEKYIFKPHNIGFIISPDYCYRTIQESEKSGSFDGLVDIRNDLEIPKPGFTAGFKYVYQKKEFVSIGLGIEYTIKGYQRKPVNILTPDPTLDLIESIEFKWNYHTLDFPIHLKFYSGKKKVRILYGIGSVLNWHLGESQTMIINRKDGTVQEERRPLGFNIRKVNLSTSASLGLSIDTGDKTYATLEPTFQYQLFRTFDAPIVEHLWSIGLQLGYFFKI